MAGLIIIGISVVIAISGYMIAPDKTTFANTQILEITLEKPGFTTRFLNMAINREKDEQKFLYAIFFGSRPEFRQVPMVDYRFSGDRIIIQEYSKYPEDEFFAEYKLVDVCYAVDMQTYHFSDGYYKVRLMNGEIVEGNIEEIQRKVEEDYITKERFLLGTDRFGRDMLSRLILGTRISLTVGFIAVIISLVLGILLGGLAGFFRGWVDKVIMWFVNVVWSVPTLLMVISITLVLGKGYWQVFIAVGLTMWVEVARIVRGQVLSIREKEYVEAARAIGVPSIGILFRHIIPNALSPVVIISAANFATAILLEAGLSFLGIGVQPPVPTWGGMIKEHYGYIIVNQGYLAFLPGLAIMIMVLAFTLVGNGLRDAIDTRM
ncbi:MAG TPA: ABC transporter permease [Bacteroidales bacterium]|nr:ABC transporter permease [Bacteroidales bacterium]